MDVDSCIVGGVKPTGEATDDSYAEFCEEGKEAINNWLWRWLPGATTLDEAEDIAGKIYQLVDAHYHQKKGGQ